MPQTIQDFYRVAQSSGFSRDFMMRVRSLGDASGNASVFNENDFVYITTKILPDRQITNQEVPYMGLKFNVPGTVVYPGSDSWEVKFLNDLNGDIRTKLESWQIGGVFNDQTSIGNLALRGPSNSIQLDLITDQGDSSVINTYVLYGVYIVSLGPVNYDNQGNGKPTDFTAKLAYQYWRHTVAQGTVVNSTTGPIAPPITANGT